MRTASPAQIRDISVPAARDGVIDPGQRGRASAAAHDRRANWYNRSRTDITQRSSHQPPGITMAAPGNEPSRSDKAASALDVPLADRYVLLIEAVQDYAIFMLDPAGKVS